LENTQTHAYNMTRNTIRNSLIALVQLYLASSSTKIAAFSIANNRNEPSITKINAVNSIKHIDSSNKEPSNLTPNSQSSSTKTKSLELRRSFLQTAIIGSCSSLIFPQPSNALVKGNSPPPPKKVGGGAKKCGNNLEECQEKAELLASEQEQKMLAEAAPVDVTKKGTRYVDVNEDGTRITVETTETDTVAKDGDFITVYYKVLKLGKRSYDGLSGEGTVVFSRGYGLEDDEDPKDTKKKSFQFQLGDTTIIKALNDAVPGMKAGTSRRIGVLPQMGWEKPGVACDGGPGGSGSGGDLKTDYAIVPTATMVATEVCLNKEKRPFPVTYAQQRRMAQRFDQSLIIEVKLVSIDKQ